MRPERQVERTPERIARNDAIFREANEAIRDAAAEHEVDIAIPFVCECAEERCRELVRLTRDEYAHVRSDPRWFVNAPGHEVAAQGWAEVVEQRDGYVIVEKLGRAGEIAEELDSTQESTWTSERAGSD